MKQKALVVDDLGGHRYAVSSALTFAGFDVDMAKDGLEGLSMAKENQFSLIFSDIEMPNMNGFELLARLRRIPNYRSTPIVMVSSLRNQVDINRAERLGATAYIVKPYTVKKIKEVLSQCGF